MVSEMDEDAVLDDIANTREVSDFPFLSHGEAWKQF
jgi:hypothetical protein